MELAYGLFIQYQMSVPKPNVATGTKSMPLVPKLIGPTNGLSTDHRGTGTNGFWYRPNSNLEARYRKSCLIFRSNTLI